MRKRYSAAQKAQVVQELLKEREFAHGAAARRRKLHGPHVLDRPPRRGEIRINAGAGRLLRAWHRGLPLLWARRRTKVIVLPHNPASVMFLRYGVIRDGA